MYLGHCLVEAEVLENLDPDEEDGDSDGGWVAVLPEPNRLEVRILVTVRDQTLEVVQWVSE